MNNLTKKEREIISNGFLSLQAFMDSTKWKGPQFEQLVKQIMKGYGKRDDYSTKQALLLNVIKAFAKDMKVSNYTMYDQKIIIAGMFFMDCWKQYKDSEVEHVARYVKDIKKAFALVRKINVYMLED